MNNEYDPEDDGFDLEAEMKMMFPEDDGEPDDGFALDTFFRDDD